MLKEVLAVGCTAGKGVKTTTTTSGYSCRWWVIVIALIVGIVPMTSRCLAETGQYRKRVHVKEPTRLDWTFAVAKRSVVEPPPEWVNHIYDSAKQTYEFYGPDENIGRGGSYPLVLFVSPAERASGWKNWESTCRQYGILFAGPHGAGNGRITSRRIRVVLDVLDDVRRRYPIDPDRTYISGFSGGAHVACELGYSLPEYFGGVIAIGGGGDPPQELWLRHRISDRLSVAFLVGSRDKVLPLVELVLQPLVAEFGARSKLWVQQGLGHRIPRNTTLENAVRWAEAGVAQRRQLAANYPSTRMAVAVSRATRAQMAMEDAQKRLHNKSTIYAGLLQLEGLRQRWPDIASTEESQRILDEYNQREHNPWKEEKQKERWRALQVKMLAHDYLRCRTKTINRRVRPAPRKNRSKGRSDYPHEYARMVWTEPLSGGDEATGSEYDDAARAVLKRLGSRVRLDHHGRVKMVDLSGTRVTPRQFRHFKAQLRGMTDLRELDLSSTVMPESVLSQVTDLTGLRAINLSHTDVTNRGMAYLSDLEHLQCLALAFTDIANAGLGQLRSLRELRGLVLGGTRVDDRLFDQLRDASNLFQLSLFSTRITDQGVRRLKELATLSYLNLGSTKVSNAACPSLAQLATLEELILDNTRITDEGLAELNELENLCHLSLEGAEISDTGLMSLGEMKSLQSLNVKNTQVTRRGIEGLRNEFPACQLHWDGDQPHDTAAKISPLDEENLKRLEEQYQLLLMDARR